MERILPAHLQDRITPVIQEHLHGETDENGDCFRAVVASLLKLSIEEVPHFLSLETVEDWWELFKSWLADIGYTAVSMGYTEEWVKDSLSDSCYLLCGPSPRFSELGHWVVGYGLEVVHDPHPENRGVLPPNEFIDWSVILLVPTTPSITKPIHN